MRDEDERKPARRAAQRTTVGAQENEKPEKKGKRWYLGKEWRVSVHSLLVAYEDDGPPTTNRPVVRILEKQRRLPAATCRYDQVERERERIRQEGGMQHAILQE